ncbi:MarR family winged helix-turn-helix transcriptional regulator [Clostridium sp. WILCCON 0269]|uniref:MarR family winged helix-turn-helix transcriptional regulator n=1 Tax=Candidatus Clostridium eludens TaxID=3381663 RepID=A0ABW8SGS5_9CLOT
MDYENKGILIIKKMKVILFSFKKNIANRFNPFNLTGTQGMLIGILHRHGEMKISDLGKKMGLSNSTISGIVDRLEKQELIKRTRSETDRRVVYISVTPKFEKSFQENFCNIEKKFEEIADKVSPEEIDIILRGLNVLEKLVNKWE